jgi:hypothetical protein
MRRIYPQLNIRRSVALILATLLLAALSVPFLSIPVSAAESGTCGDGLSWSLSAGTLTISGKGDMTEFTELNMAPWFEQRDRITRVVITDGVQSIAPLAFYDCKKLTRIVVPNGVTSIGQSAFGNCSALKNITLPSSIKQLGYNMVFGCYALRDIYFDGTADDWSSVWKFDEINNCTIHSNGGNIKN